MALFNLKSANTNPTREVVAGLTTFLTMAYIVFVQPGMMAAAGMDQGAVFIATCVASAAATLAMGLYARYPIALAPGMGINAFFAFTLAPAVGWPTALGVVLVSGLVFLALALVGVREAVMNAVSPSLKHAIAAGIGLFIAFIGLKNAGLVVDHPATFVTMNHDWTQPGLIVFFVGLLVAAVLYAWKIPGALVLGIAAAFGTALAFHAAGGLEGFSVDKQIVSLPPDPSATLFKLDLAGVFTWAVLPYVVVFLFVDLFDTLGTLIGVAERGNFLKDNKLPRAGRALTCDAGGTVFGALLGTSTVTSYIESAAGVEAGGRTGLVNVVVAACFLLCLFFSPIIAMVGSYPPITAPALVLVGAMMMRSVGQVAWEDWTEALPAFVVLAVVPLTFSIGDGIAMGFLTYAILKLATGKIASVHPVVWILAVLLAAYLTLVRPSVG
ncbi:MAG: NCS2 family permease [Planctomycetota bacterium]